MPVSARKRAPSPGRVAAAMPAGTNLIASLRLSIAELSTEFQILKADSVMAKREAAEAVAQVGQLRLALAEKVGIHEIKDLQSLLRDLASKVT